MKPHALSENHHYFTTEGPRLMRILGLGKNHVTNAKIPHLQTVVVETVLVIFVEVAHSQIEHYFFSYLLT